MNTASRVFFEKTVKRIIRNYNKYIFSYGSFSNSSFHLTDCGETSFSDIDLYCLTPVSLNNRIEISNDICEKVFHKTGLKLRVSLRPKRIHLPTISKEQSNVLAKLEYLVKTSSLSTDHHIKYQASKLLLRTLDHKTYYNSPLDLNSYVKRGMSPEIARALIANKIGNSSTLELKGCAFMFGATILFENNVTRFIRDTFDGKRLTLAESLWHKSLYILDEKPELIVDITTKLIESNLLPSNHAITNSSSEIIRVRE